MGQSQLARNKKAFHDFSVEESLECGIELQGTEVKSIKSGRFSFADSHARIRDDELYLVALHISEYDHGNIHNHKPTRERRLLAHKQEIKRLRRRVTEKGYTLVPLTIYLKNGLVKVEIGLCKGKKLHDKRETIKARDMKREQAREMKGNL